MRSFAWLVALFLSQSPALANDSEMGGSGSDLVPLKNSVIRMAEEDILLDGSDGSVFVVTAKYRFENPSDQKVKVTMGFPEKICPDKEECGDGQRFSKMKTLVRGQEVKHTVGQVGAEHEWHDEFGDVWLYDVTFAPQEVVSIEHTYEMFPGGSVAGDKWIHYVTRTGALWSGPIGTARFTFRVPYPALLWRIVAPLPREGAVTRGASGDKEYLELSFATHEWTPNGDISLTYVNEDYYLPFTGSGEEGTRRFSFSRAAERTKMYGAQCEILETLHAEVGTVDAKDEAAVQAAAEKLAQSNADLRICRNAVFARHGKIFQDPSLNAYFYGSPNPAPSKSPYFPFEANPKFDEKQLFKSDWTMIAVVQRAEALRPPKESESPGRNNPSTAPPSPAPHSGAARIQTVQVPSPTTRGGCTWSAPTPFGVGAWLSWASILGLAALMRFRRSADAARINLETDGRRARH